MSSCVGPAAEANPANKRVQKARCINRGKGVNMGPHLQQKCVHNFDDEPSYREHRGLGI